MQDIYFWRNQMLPKTLSKEELIRLFENYYNGDMLAREQIITHNLRFVIHEVKKFYNVPYDDDELISIGIEGLIKAVDTFDISKNISFSSYAGRCIENKILAFIRNNKKYLDNDVSLYDVVANGKDSGELLLADTLVDDSLDFISKIEDESEYELVKKLVEDLSNRDKKVIKMYFGFDNGKCYSQNEIAEYFEIAQSYVSRIIKKVLIKLKDTMEEEKIIDVVEDSSTDYISELSGKTVYEVINKLLEEIPSPDREIIKMYYGIDYDRCYKQAEIVNYSRLSQGHISILIKKGLNEIYEKMQKIRGLDTNLLNNNETIYDIFKDYSKEDVDYVISNLDNKDKKIITLRYGDDLENPVISDKWNWNYTFVFNTRILNRIKVMLDNIPRNSEENYISTNLKLNMIRSK